jgi:uncharacterized membrane protein
MDRPKIKLRFDKIDLTIEAISILGLVLVFGLILSSYQALPETLPSHYDFNGRPDRFSSKSIIWFLPAIALVTYIGLTILSRFPHIYNYPYDITIDNAERQYRNSAMMIRVLKTLIVFQLLYIAFVKIKIGLGELSELGVLFIPITLILILGVVGMFAYRGFKLR